jgi:hypothetical protein
LLQGVKKCPSCGKHIYHETWKVTPELAEARLDYNRVFVSSLLVLAAVFWIRNKQFHFNTDPDPDISMTLTDERSRLYFLFFKFSQIFFFHL